MATDLEKGRVRQGTPTPLQVPLESSASLAEELASLPEEPFLPVEAKLVGWSVSVGAILLGFLFWLSYTFFAG